MELNHILLKEENSESEYKISLRSDKTLCFSTIKLLIPNIVGIEKNGLFLNIDSEKNIVNEPIDSWNQNIYFAKQLKVSETSVQSIEEIKSKIQKHVNYYQDKNALKRGESLKRKSRETNRNLSQETPKKDINIKIGIKKSKGIDKDYFQIKTDSGGVRIIQFENENEVTVDKIIEKAIDIFFPLGENSELGCVSKYKFALEDQDKNKLTEFRDRFDNICTFKQYCSGSGRYMSRVKFYLLPINKDYEKKIKSNRNSYSDTASGSEIDVISQNITKNFELFPKIEENVVSQTNDYLDLIYYENIRKGEWNGTPLSIRNYKLKQTSKVKQFLIHEFLQNYRLVHPNIISLLAYSLKKESISCYFECIEGYNMQSVIETDYRLEELKNNTLLKNKVSLEIIIGFAYMHNLKPPIFHRDVKPLNILITEQSYVPKICDFGSEINDLSEKNNDLSFYLKSDIPYCSPNILLNNKIGSETDDIWSIGCTLAYFYTEKEIYNYEEGLTYDQKKTIIINKMSEKEIPEAFNNLENSQKKILLKCIDYDESKRSSAINLVEIFKKFERILY